MIKTIAVAMGGYSSEADISLQSGEVVYKHLSTNPKYRVYKAHILKKAGLLNWILEKNFQLINPIFL